MSTLSDLRHYIRRQRLIPASARVIVGVSGGPDSLSLLHALRQLAPEHGWTLHAAYLHHGLRPEADDEARFVVETAAGWGIGGTVGTADVRAIAAQPGVSLEEAARQARYAFLGRVALQQRASIVAVGHNADDQAETILMHLLRGSGLAGLRGMLPVSSLAELHLAALPPEQRPDFGDLRLARPWLATPRSHILAYCQEHGLQPRQDLTNTDPAFFRNRLRHEVLPLLRQINPQLTQVWGRTAAVIAGDHEALSQYRQTLWSELAQAQPERVRLNLAAFRALPRGDQRALLRQAITVLRPELRNIAWEHTESLLDVLADDPNRASGGPYPLVSGLTARLNHRWLDMQTAPTLLVDSPQVDGAHVLPLPGALALNQSWRLTAAQVRWSPAADPPWVTDTDPHRLWLPLSIPPPLVVRPRLPGDRIHLFGLNGSKSVADLMTELKLPGAARGGWPLLVAGDGDILWLIGHRASEHCRLPAAAAAAWEIHLQSSIVQSPI